MPCSLCANNGNGIGCPCQDVAKDNCPMTFANNRTVFRDQCTGETKRALPYNAAQAREQYDVVAVKVVPKKKQNPCNAVKQPCQERKCCKPERRTVCYTCAPKRADAYPADHKCYKLEYLDAFEKFDVGQCEKNDWNYFTNMEDFTADDGKHRVTKDGLLMTARQFKKTVAPSDLDSEMGQNSNGFLDHFKTMTVLNTDLEVPDCGELYAEACMAARTYNTDKHPFGDAVLNPYSDLRLASAGFSLIDFDTGLHVGVLLTNDSIYALYERLPLDNDDNSDDDSGAAAFAFAHLIGRRNYRNPLSDFARYGVALDKRKGAKWYVNGVLKHSVDRLGHLSDPSDALYHLGGEPTDISLKCVHLGFGLFTMLDAVHPSNNRDLDAAGTGLVRLTDFKYHHPWVHDRQVEFVSEEGDEECRLFGQGASLKIKEIKVELRA